MKIKLATMRLFLTFLLFSSVFFSYGQTFIPGYIITNDGDSILLGLRDRLPLPCFQGPITNENGEIRTYTPNDIQAYGYIGSKRFEVFEIDSSKVFLQVLVSGKLSFYQGLKFYYIKERELIKLYNFQPDESAYYPSFKTILNTFFSECAPLSSDHIKYTEKEITKLIQAYNKCKTGDEGTVLKKQYPDKAFHFTAKLGSGYNVWSLNNLDWDVNDPHLSLDFSAGIGLDFSMPSKINRFHLALEVFFEKSTLDFYGESSVVKMNTFHLKIPIGLRYHAFLRDNTPYLGFGYLPYVSFAPNQTTTDVISYYKPYTIHVTTVNNEPWTQHGIWAYAGYQQSITHKLKLNFEFRYEESAGKIRGDLNIPTYISSLGFYIGIRY